MAFGDLYTVVVKGTLFSQQVINVWQYYASDPSTDAGDLAGRFEVQTLTSLMPLLNVGLVWDTIEVRNLFTPFDQIEVATTLAGVIVDQGLPAFNTASLQIAHNSFEVGDGRKAIAGISEVNQSDGGLSTTFVSALDAWANTDLLDGLVGPGALGVIYLPIVIKRVKYTTPTGGTAYRFPENDIEAVFGIMTAGITKALVSTQLSRKPIIT